ncbi:MAG: HAD family phosphatase [Candidatus Promineifilaceae bacterium]|nr:HAD family phosphatase [Candidatus Promineifilaceae bacterium]
MKDAVVFDLDGLMVDTEPLSRQAWKSVLSAYRQPFPEALYASVLGLRIEDSAARLQAGLDLPVSPAELIEQKSAAMAALVAGGVPPMPGLHRLLTALDARGLPWGVATSSRRGHAHEILTQLGLWSRCQALAAGDEVQRGKPAPDVYLLAARRLDVRPTKCLALEDSLTGARAARAAGMVTVLVAPDRGPAPEAVHFHRRSLVEVAADLQQFLAWSQD